METTNSGFAEDLDFSGNCKWPNEMGCFGKRGAKLEDPVEGGRHDPSRVTLINDGVLKWRHRIGKSCDGDKDPSE